MARTVEDILREQLGNLMLQLSIVQSQAEQLREANLKLEAELKKDEKEVKED